MTRRLVYQLAQDRSDHEWQRVGVNGRSHSIRLDGANDMTKLQPYIISTNELVTSAREATQTKTHI